MRYFIGNLIRGEAAEYYKTTCADLAARFGIEDVSAIVPPHITVKTAFEKPSVEAIDDLLALNTEAPVIPLSFSSWNHFTTRTIFLEGKNIPQELKSYAKDIVSKLASIGIPSSPQDQELHIRMSLARFLKPEQYENVWKYLQSTPTPSFDINFDNLTIFVKEKREDKAWKVLKTFPLTGKK